MQREPQQKPKSFTLYALRYPDEISRSGKKAKIRKSDFFELN
jgi:hypothetical protein